MLRYVLLLLFCPPLWAVWGPPTYRAYDVEVEGEPLDAYVVRPTGVGATLLEGVGQGIQSAPALFENQWEAAHLCGIAANFVEKRSTELGHINEHTSADYALELYQLRNGFWPFVMITDRDRPENVRYLFAFAIQWESTTLPVFDRFFGRHSELPKAQHTITLRLSEPEEMIYRLFYPHPTGVGDFPAISRILERFPWIIGSETELKFFMKDPEFKQDVSDVMQALIMLHELHRWSGMVPPEKLLAPQKEMLLDPENHAILDEVIDRLVDQLPLAKGPNGLAYFEGLRASLKSGVIQSTVMNSKFVAQISGRSRNGKETAIKRQWVRAFHFPEESEWAFEEHLGAGTPGIFTDIYELDLKEYELGVASAILGKTEDFGIAQLYALNKKIVPKQPTLRLKRPSCVQMMSLWAARAHKASSQNPPRSTKCSLIRWRSTVVVHPHFV